jgi:hypothetical protein
MARAMPINVPILLTWLRILLIPVFVAVYYVPDAWLAPAAKNWTAMAMLLSPRLPTGSMADRAAPGLTTAFGAFSTRR